MVEQWVGCVGSCAELDGPPETDSDLVQLSKSPAMYSKIRGRWAEAPTTAISTAVTMLQPPRSASTVMSSDRMLASLFHRTSSRVSAQHTSHVDDAAAVSDLAPAERDVDDALLW